MAEEKEKKNKEEILAGWARISKEYRTGDLTEQEKAQFKRAQFDEKQAKKTRFVLGEPIRSDF